MGNRSVLFTLRPRLSDGEKKLALSRAKQVTGVTQIAPLDESSPAEPVRRIFFASLADSADSEAVWKALEDLPHVESASLPTERKLS